jgi:RNA polymerase sigma factor (sigma-70 family)
MNNFTRFAARNLAFNGGYKNYFKIFSADFAKIALGGVVIIEGYLLLNFLSGGKGGTSMNPHNHEEHIRHSFDSYCKRILKRKVLDIHRENKRRSKHEITFSDMSAQEFFSLSVTDNYFTDEFVFDVLGESVGVANTELAGALNELSAHRRDIVLMSYFFDMTDREIAERLKMARRTVAYQRTSTLRELKKFLESEE